LASEHAEVTTVTAAVLGDRGLPWTEEDYLELGETKDRLELFDGSLLVTPAPTPRHQHLSRLLANALDGPARSSGLEVYEAINIRLKKGRIPIPDVAIVTPIDPNRAVVDVEHVRLVCKIVSPGNPAIDRVLKMQLYAEAGIGWCLLVEQDGGVLLQLFRLDGEHYVEHAAGAPGVPLELTDPLTARIDPAAFG
jgi:Uma2 family endonuclease